MNIESKNIGVFGTTLEQMVRKIQSLSKSLPHEDIVKIQLSKNTGACFIEMKNGERYIGVLTNQGARGYRWKQVYVPYNVDLEILHNVIRCKLISNLPEHEQIIWY